MILQGDCIERMAELDEASVDAIVCDPPYGIGFMGHEWDQPGTTGRKFGKVTEHGCGHHKAAVSPSMVAGEYDRSLSANQGFQRWCEAWAVEAFRVLKPGGHLLSSCGTRTYHRMASGIEDAGFEIRDSLIWIYGSGFPKSLDVSKAIDKAATCPRCQGAGREHMASASRCDELPRCPDCNGTGRATRKVTGSKAVTRNLDRNGRTGDEAISPVPVEGTTIDLTAPATPEAAQWEGWGTALKPSHEPVVVARKPLSAGGVTVRVNVENGLRDQGVIGDIKWTIKPASDAEQHDPLRSSSVTPRPPTEGTSVDLAGASATGSVGRPTARSSAPNMQPGATPTESTPAHTQSGGGTHSEMKSSTPTAEDAPAAGNPKSSSSPSTTSTEAGPHTAGRSTERSTSKSDATDSPTPTESFAGIATGLSGSRASVRINRLSNGTFEWPDDLPERTSGGSTVAANVLEHGTGALNVDGCRVGTTKDVPASPRRAPQGSAYGDLGNDPGDGGGFDPNLGRWPANLALSHLPECGTNGVAEISGPREVANPAAAQTQPDGGSEGSRIAAPDSCAPGCPVAELDRQSGELTSGKGVVPGERRDDEDGWRFRSGASIGDTGGASRFFYTAKASRAERNAGLDGFEERAKAVQIQQSEGRQLAGQAESMPTRNPHPTVKPIDLMRWLCRLITPPGGTILDPFMGSGTTGIAAHLEGFDFIGIEREAEYAAIAEARIEWWLQFPAGTDTEAALGIESVERKHREAGQGSLLEEAA